MTAPCTRLATLLAETPEAGRALATLEAGLAAHAESCPHCQAELANAERLVVGLTTLHADFEPLPFSAEGAERRTLNKERAPTPRTSSSLRGYLIAGVLGAAAATAAVLALQSGSPQDEKDQKIAEPARRDNEGRPARALGPATPNTKATRDSDGLGVAACLGDGGETSCQVGSELTTNIGETRAFRLSDGSTLQVDQDTVVRFSDGRRALRVVRGDVFIDAAHREDLDALVVELPTGEIQVIGTELEVRAGESLSVVDVVKGVVTAVGSDGEARVKAGQTAWLRAGKKPIVRASAGTAGHDWARPKKSGADEAYANLGFGSIRARRPGATADADKPLRLVDHLVDVRMQGAMAKTTVEESFASDEAHELEGIYRFTLPPGAQVAELALMVDGRWEEGAYVERDRAEKIWAGVIRQAMPVVKRREIIEYIWVPGPWRDPALLSQKQGNTFELRIFPIPARGERRVKISYTESLPLITGARRYVLPLPTEGANASAERFAVAMKVGTSAPPADLRVRNYELERGVSDGQVTLGSETRSFRAKGDLVVEVPDMSGAEDLVTQGWSKNGDGYVALSLRPELAASDAEHVPLDVVVIADTSYGMQKVRLGRAGDMLAGIVAGLAAEDRVQVLACATSCRSLGAFEKASQTLGRDLGARLASLEPLGATRLAAAFDAAKKALDDTPSERRRIIYLGDGVQTVGELDPARIVDAVRASLGETRITTVGLGGETDHLVLGGLTKDNASSFVDYAVLGSTDATVDMVLARQHGEPLRDVELVLPEGLSETAPARLGDVWPGEERIVTARSAAASVAGEVVLRGTLAGEPVERRWRIDVALDDAQGNAFVPRLWAERRIADLAERDDLGTKAEVVKISQAHHVLSRFTSLLVLESPAMARAFDVHSTRAVADWSGDEAAASEGGEVVSKTGALEDPAEREAAGPNKPGETASTEDQKLAKNTFESGEALFGGDTRDSAKDAKEIQPSAEPVFGTTSTLGHGNRGGSGAPAPTVPMRRDFDRNFNDDGGRSGGGRWVQMKKVWYKEAAISDHADRDDAGAERELAARERKLDDEPESRERTMALVRWHVRMNQTDRAERLTQRWLEKDRMDPEALVTLADIAALRGDIERSKSLLSSAVEADPHKAPAHLRMARLYDAAGESSLACEHRLSRALVARSDAAAQVEAIRCGAREARVLAGLEEGVRGKVERALEKDPKPTRVTGPWRLDASWDAAADLDLVVVSPQGRVVSWQGGADLTVEDADSERDEKLVFKGSDNGRWQVFVVRKDGDERVRAEGTLRITAHGTSRRIAFVIGDDEQVAPVADIDVAARFRMEQVP